MKVAVRVIRDGEVIDENWTVDENETIRQVLDRAYSEFGRKYKQNQESPFFVFDSVKLVIDIQKQIE